VPAAAVLETASGSSVFIVDDGRAVRRRVQRGESYDGRIEIVSGLAPGDSVIVAGNAELRDGTTVRLSQAPAPSAATSATEAGRPIEGGSR
jgi:membrane fusion protein (multidrug efflux system)